MSKEEDVGSKSSKPEDEQEHAQLGATGGQGHGQNEAEGQVALQMEGLSGQPNKQHYTEEEDKILEVVSA